MKPVDVKVDYREVIDEVGFSDAWNEDLAWFEPLDWAGLQAQDGIEHAVSVTLPGTWDSSVVCVLRTSEPLAPRGDTTRMGMWYLYRTSLAHPERLVAVLRGDYDYSAGKIIFKRGAVEQMGLHLPQYVQVLQGCIWQYRHTSVVDD